MSTTPYQFQILAVFFKDFHARTANFTIPKTKKQTAKERLLKNNGSKKVATQLQLIPNAQGRPTKRTSSDEERTTPKKLRRPWLYAKPPQDSDDVAGNHGQDSSSPTGQYLNIRIKVKLTKTLLTTNHSSGHGSDELLIALVNCIAGTCFNILYGIGELAGTCFNKL